MGILPHITASVLGLAAILHASAVAFQVVKFAGVAYLFYLAWGIWRDSGKLAIDDPDLARRLRASCPGEVGKDPPEAQRGLPTRRRDACARRSRSDGVDRLTEGVKMEPKPMPS